MKSRIERQRSELAAAISRARRNPRSRKASANLDRAAARTRQRVSGNKRFTPPNGKA